jgi:serine/threonine protein phosphatase PrpC
MKLLCDGFSETGMRRNINQDAVGMFFKEDCGLFLVSDGMGGHSEGERASQEIEKACENWWEARLKEEKEADFSETVSQLKELLAQASRTIWDETSQEEICGATVVLLWIQQQSYALLWAGDSRCYLTEQKLLGTRIRQLTIDDVWENQPELSQQYSKDEILSHPNRGKLVRAAGVHKNFTCRVQTGIQDKKMLFALMSDGVYKYMEPGKLRAALKQAARGEDFTKPLQEIRNGVYDNQAPDNLSCILIKAV